ncbi:flagellar motor protein MotB [Sandaracinomonas limnophila]|uniref:Flagellar motor protein MotB n=1 Tax=Sandaracinomonas limnophila TaxID=1862386 RepID=A0A437PWP9_9BACT|nr:OmpA family protein [Sandaracinomonas limnophila]RVU26673.1 flagellar motor protein MotB [Sandaracinomonas limnophila]
MRKFGGFIFLFLAFSFSMAAQKVHWAQKVLTVSSEFSDPLIQTRENKAIQILGKPSKYPKFGPSGAAWQTLTADSPDNEYIIVEFDSLMSIRQVAIFENFGAGSITQVDGLDLNKKIYPIKTFNPGYQRANGQVTNIVLPQLTSFQVKYIRITLNSQRIKGYSQIDAVGITNSTKPIEESIQLPINSSAEFFRENMGSHINSDYNEICPVISPDGQTLYFTRWKHPDNIGKFKNQDIWYSTLDENKEWSKAKLFPEPINNEENNAICGISPNGKTLLLNNVYKQDGTMEKGVSFAYLLRTGDWSFPVQAKIKNFKNRSEYSEYTLAPNGKILVFTTEMKNSFGAKDMYVSFASVDGTWTEPQNLGPVVNTGEAESTPFIAPDGVTLYFSSPGHIGYGNNDIFMTRRLDDTWTNWSEPENLGPVINTPQWDGYFSVSAKGDYAYFSSVNEKNNAEDIYRIKIPEKVKPLALVQMTGQIQLKKSLEPTAAQIFIKGPLPSDTLTIEHDPYLGDYSFLWPAKKAFTIEVKKKGFLTLVEKFDYSKEKLFTTVKRNFVLDDLPLNKRFNLPNLIFEQSKSDLLPEGLADLDKIILILQENTTYKVFLEGFTDNQGDWNENLLLSQKRVNNVKDYLVSKGISEERIRTKAWGSSNPVSSNLIEEKRKFNRRVEFTIVNE